MNDEIQEINPSTSDSLGIDLSTEIEDSETIPTEEPTPNEQYTTLLPTESDQLTLLIGQNENLIQAVLNNGERLESIFVLLLSVLIAFVARFVYRTLFDLIG